MIRYVLPTLAALAICAFGVSATTAQAESSEPAGMDRMQHWAADHEALLDARLAGLKAVLKLTPDQDKLWTPFEAAVRDAAKMRMEHMKAMMDRMQKMRETMGQDKSDTKDMGPAGQEASPVDRLETLAQRMSERGAALEKVAGAAKPLYTALDDTQKRLFGFCCKFRGSPYSGYIDPGRDRAWQGNGSGRQLLQGASIHSGSDSVGGCLSDVPGQLPRSRAHAHRPRCRGGPHDDLPLDPGLCRGA